MPVSEAQKRASRKWDSSRDSITIRIEKETGAAIRAAAAVQEISVTQYVLNCVKATTSGGNMALPVMLQKKIYEHLEITGESLQDFLARAAAHEMEHDKRCLSMGLPIHVDTKEGIVYPKKSEVP